MRMFTFIHLNFKWKHSNLRLRLYLHGIQTIDKYKTIAKILQRLIQVNLMKPRCRHKSAKKKSLWFFFTVTLLPFIKLHSPPVLFSVTQHHKKCWDPPTLFVPFNSLSNTLSTLFTFVLVFSMKPVSGHYSHKYKN